MQPDGPSSPHLTYCTNIHPGETWPTVRDNFDRYVLPIRDRFAPGVPFGVGLRLSAKAAAELSEQQELADFQAFLREHDLYVFTLNGFPYGPFHGTPVKEDVYLPNWMEPERLDYTDRLAAILEKLLPETVEGTISTVPGAFAPLVTSEDDVRQMAMQMARHAANLYAIRERSGKRISLAIEPEPCCFVEAVADTIDFFERYLYGRDAIETLAAMTGVRPQQAVRILREHLTVCFDACHMAVEFEEAGAALAAFREAGIRIGKFQISAGLRVLFTGDAERDAETLRRLAEFADPVYLHQVVERTADGQLRRFLDLPEALRAAEGDPAARQWRIHFHVPLFREQLGPFESTQPFLRDLIRLLDGGRADQNWEVETYTWDVLPREFRAEGVIAAVAREMEWVVDEIRAVRG